MTCSRWPTCAKRNIYGSTSMERSAAFWPSRPTSATAVRGMQRADLLALDLHKWMYIPYEAGCSLVANREAHRRAFAEHPDYLARGARRSGRRIELVQRLRRPALARFSGAKSVDVIQRTRHPQVRADGGSKHRPGPISGPPDRKVHSSGVTGSGADKHRLLPI